MLDIAEIEKADMNYHWALNLVHYSTHPLKDIILDYVPYGRLFFQNSYIYLGKLLNNKTICIIHFHSSFKGPMKFMSMQNLDSYKAMMELNSEDIANISMNITRDTVIDLSKVDALSVWHLDIINSCDYCYITDETGFVKSYTTLFYGG